MQKIKHKIDSLEAKKFSYFDPNPIHKMDRNNSRINGCVSGLYIIQLVNKLIWNKKVLCANEFNTSFLKPLFPNDKIILSFKIKEKKNYKRDVIFYIKRDKEMCCSGIIKQIIKKCHK